MHEIQPVLAGWFHAYYDILASVFRHDFPQPSYEILESFQVILKCNWLPELDSTEVLCPSYMFKFCDVYTNN
jgi:hypothetical protein